MKDKCNREIKNIRFSITSKCNYNCLYCDKEGYVQQGRELTVDEITKICYILAKILKVKRIKLTGGEPLCRKEVIQIVQNIYDLGLYDDISITTNGYLLLEKAQDLINVGLNRVNVSLCSLKPERYSFITGSNSLPRILEGLKKAQDVGLHPIKLNFVMLKGINDDELEDMINFCANTGYILQLIELHDFSDAIGKTKEIYDKYYLNLEKIIDDISKRAIDIKVRKDMQNRKVFRLPNNAIVETVHPSHDFCMGCTKLRVSSDGKVFGCLYAANLGKDFISDLEESISLNKYEMLLKEIIDSREPHY